MECWIARVRRSIRSATDSVPTIWAPTKRSVSSSKVSRTRIKPLPGIIGKRVGSSALVENTLRPRCRGKCLGEPGASDPEIAHHRHRTVEKAGVFSVDSQHVLCGNLGHWDRVGRQLPTDRFAVNAGMKSCAVSGSPDVRNIGSHSVVDNQTVALMFEEIEIEKIDLRLHADGQNDEVTPPV